MTSVYKIPQKIKCLSDKRERKAISLFNIVMPMRVFLMLQYERFHTVFSLTESMSRRLRNCISGKIPKVDAVRDLLSSSTKNPVRTALPEKPCRRNRIFPSECGLYDGWKGDACDPGAGNVKTEGRSGKGKKGSFQRGKKTVEVWGLSKFEIENCPYSLRVVRYHETWQENRKGAERWMWLVTTLEQTPLQVLWEMLNRRLDIEENGFHQLKTYYHANHCYCHAAVETIIT